MSLHNFCLQYFSWIGFHHSQHSSASQRFGFQPALGWVHWTLSPLSEVASWTGVRSFGGADAGFNPKFEANIIAKTTEQRMNFRRHKLFLEGPLITVVPLRVTQVVRCFFLALTRWHTMVPYLLKGWTLIHLAEKKAKHSTIRCLSVCWRSHFSQQGSNTISMEMPAFCQRQAS